MRVHKDFKKWCDNIRGDNKELSSVKITKLLIKHNSSDIIKEDIRSLENGY